MKKEQFTSWLLPVPEKEHLRILYVGRLQPGGSSETPERESNIYDMMDDVWKVSSD